MTSVSGQWGRDLERRPSMTVEKKATALSGWPMLGPVALLVLGDAALYAVAIPGLVEETESIVPVFMLVGAILLTLVIAVLAV